MLTQHYAMLQRNLLYTGITRGKRLVVLVGQKKAVGANRPLKRAGVREIGRDESTENAIESRFPLARESVVLLDGCDRRLYLRLCSPMAAAIRAPVPHGQAAE